MVGVIVFIIGMGKEHLGVDVSSEAQGALQEFFRARGKLWLKAEVQTKAKEGMVG